MKENGSELQSSSKSKFEDDSFELIDLLRIFWQWKYLILIGTIICAIAGGFVSYQKVQNFRISTILVLNSFKMIDDFSSKVTGMRNEEVESANDIFYIDSAANIKAAIELGALNDDLITYLSNVKNIDILSVPQFSIALLGNDNYLQVSCLTSDVKLGVNILNSLPLVVLKKYEPIIQALQNRLIHNRADEIADLERRLNFLKTDIASASKRINELESDKKALSKNINALHLQRDKILRNSNSIDTLPLLLYANTIQHIMSLSNTYNANLFNYVSGLEHKKQEVKMLDLQIKNHQKEQVALANKLKNFPYIQVVQSPENNIQSIETKTKLLILIGTIAGFILMLVIALFLDYVLKALNQNQS